MDRPQLLLLLGRMFHNRLGQRMEHTNKAARNDDMVVHEDRKEEEGNISNFCCVDSVGAYTHWYIYSRMTTGMGWVG